jgi:DNA-binding transcriptional MerR regulator
VETQSIKRLYYSISEVSQLVDEEQYVLRYWETEFEQLRPQKNRAGNRIYIEKDVELLRIIKHLLRDKRYTIDGAKEHLRNLAPPPPSGESLLELQPDLHPEPSVKHSTELSDKHSTELSNTFSPAPEPSKEAAYKHDTQMIPAFLTNGQSSKQSNEQNNEQKSQQSITEPPQDLFIPILPPPTSVRGLSREELLQMRDTLRELLQLLETSPEISPVIPLQNTSHTA